MNVCAENLFFNDCSAILPYLVPNPETIPRAEKNVKKSCQLPVDSSVSLVLIGGLRTCLFHSRRGAPLTRAGARRYIRSRLPLAMDDGQALGGTKELLAGEVDDFGFSRGEPHRRGTLKN
jgi:hypothetical protein